MSFRSRSRVSATASLVARVMTFSLLLHLGCMGGWACGSRQPEAQQEAPSTAHARKAVSEQVRIGALGPGEKLPEPSKGATLPGGRHPD